MNEYGNLRQNNGFGWLGFANIYLEQFKKESKSNNRMDKHLYTQLIALDIKLGNPPSKQLFECLRMTTRPDIVKVLI